MPTSLLRSGRDPRLAAHPALPAARAAAGPVDAVPRPARCEQVRVGA